MLAVVAGALLDVDERSYLYGFGLGLAFVLAAGLLLLPKRKLAMPVLLLLLVAPDVTQSNVDVVAVGSIRTATIWQLSLGPVTPAIVVFVLFGIAALRLPATRIARMDKLVLGYLLVAPTFASFYFGYAVESTTMFMSDLRFVLFLGVSLIFFQRYFAAYPEEFWRVVALAAVLLVGRYALDLLYLLAGVQRTLISGVNRVSVDSAKGLAVVPFFLLLARLRWARGRWWAVLALPLPLLLLVAYQTRWLVLMLLLGLVLLLASVRLRDSIAVGVLVVSLFLAVLPLATRFLPEVVQITQARFSTMTRLQRLDLAAIDVTRVTSIVNSTSLLLDRKALLTGVGYGSWYTDTYAPAPFLDESAFTVEQLMSRRFYKVHDFIFHTLFKVGLIGLGAYMMLVLRPMLQLWRRRRAALAAPRFRELFIVAIGATPIVLTTLYWTGKGVAIVALFIVVLRTAVNRLDGGGGAPTAHRQRAARAPV